MRSSRFGEIVELVVRAASENRRTEGYYIMKFRLLGRIEVLVDTSEVACNMDHWVCHSKFAQKVLAAPVQWKAPVTDNDGSFVVGVKGVAEYFFLSKAAVGVSKLFSIC